MKTAKDIKEQQCNEVCVCIFRVIDAKLFFKTGNVQPVADDNTVSNVKQVIKAVVYHYDDHPVKFVCSSGVFFVYVYLNKNGNEYNVLKFLTRVAYQIQKYLLQKLCLVVSGCITKGKCLMTDNTKICLCSAKIVFDVKICSILVQPYICVDDVTFSAEAKLLLREKHLFKTEDDIYVINYFRFLKDVVSMQFVVDCITKVKIKNSKQILLFKNMFDKACEKLKIDATNNC